MSRIKLLCLGILTNLSVVTVCSAANIVNENSHKAVNNVHWYKTKPVDVTQLLQQQIPTNAASVFFLRRADKDVLQTSANIAINDRFQVSLQPGNYSQIYSCAGINQISGDITGNKTNDLLKNYLTFKLEPNTTYYFDVDVDNQGNTTIKPITREKAHDALQHMSYQTHQITRVVPNCPVAPTPTTAPPAPIIVAPVQPVQYETIELKILFDNDKSNIKQQYYPEVKQVADFMSRHPEVTATIEGHTDSNASDAYNVALSQRRVDAVKRLLIDTYGIDASRLNSVGYGESRPIATNSTPEGRQQNRRVVAVFQAN